MTTEFEHLDAFPSDAPDDGTSGTTGDTGTPEEVGSSDSTGSPEPVMPGPEARLATPTNGDATPAAPDSSPVMSPEPAPASAPEYFTRDNAQQMLGAFGQNIMRQVSQQISQVLGQALNQRQVQPQPSQEQAPLIPEDPLDLQEWTPQQWHKTLAHLSKENESLRGMFTEKFERMERERAVTQRAEQISNYVDNQIGTSIKSLPAFKNPDGTIDREMVDDLRWRVANAMQMRGLNNVSIPTIAKAINDSVMKRVDHRYNAKVQGVKNAASRPATPRPATPSVAQPKPAGTMQEAHNQFRAAIKSMASED